MHSKAKAATKAERKRMEKIVELGCVACRMDGWTTHSAEIHHLLNGGFRRGHLFTIGLCFWHHRGVKWKIEKTIDENTTDHGPSLAFGSRPFHAHYGTDDELLEYQNTLLAAIGFKGGRK